MMYASVVTKKKKGRRDEEVPPDIPPEKATPLLQRQLEALQRFKGKRASEVNAEEVQWKNLTEKLIIRIFGKPSTNLNQFYTARSAGEHSLMGVSERQLDANLSKRVTMFESFLKSSLDELKIDVPASEIKGSYEAGEHYELHRDLGEILMKAAREVLIVDPYLDDGSFDLYVGRIARGIKVHVLVDSAKNQRRQQALETVAKKFALSRGNFELRDSQDIHDRYVFVDDRGWVIGQSIKDAARTKPTYMVEIQDVSRVLPIYESVWSSAVQVVKG